MQLTKLNYIQYSNARLEALAEIKQKENKHLQEFFVVEDSTTKGK